jgi:hypothetical protein
LIDCLVVSQSRNSECLFSTKEATNHLVKPTKKAVDHSIAPTSKTAVNHLAAQEATNQLVAAVDHSAIPRRTATNQLVAPIAADQLIAEEEEQGIDRLILGASKASLPTTIGGPTFPNPNPHTTKQAVDHSAAPTATAEEAQEEEAQQEDATDQLVAQVAQEAVDHLAAQEDTFIVFIQNQAGASLKKAVNHLAAAPKRDTTGHHLFPFANALICLAIDR